MRMGKVEKERRGAKTPRADAQGKPAHAAKGSIVGKLSPDLIATYYGPELLALATEGLENYAAELMDYQDLVKMYQKDAAEEAEIGADGEVHEPRGDPPIPPAVPLFRSQHWVDEFSEMLSETSEHFQAKKSGGWRVAAKAAKFERHLDEKYGRLRPLIKNHPEIEHFVRNVQRKYATGHFSPFRQGKPPIPRGTAVIILFMMKRGNMAWDVLMLSSLFFLVGLQPWALVVLVAGGHSLLENRRKKPLKPMKRYIPAVEPYYQTLEDGADVEQRKKDILLEPVGKPLKEAEQIDTSDYDTVLLGSGPSLLYTAALLSRAGRKVLVLSSRSDASGCFVIDATSKKFKNVPFDVDTSNVSRIGACQKLLTPALSTSTDYQGGVRFAQVGSEADGYAFEILSVPGMGTDGGDSQIPFVLRAEGARALMDDAAQLLGDGWPGIHGQVGNSASGSYVDVCKAINGTSNQFYISKILADKVNDMRTNSPYYESSIRYASSFLDRSFPLNAHARSLMAAIGMKGENIKPSQSSMGAHASNVSAAMSGEGMHYPIGGPRALCHAFATVIEQSGGRIVTSVPVAELMFQVDEAEEKPKEKPKEDGKEEEKEGNAPRCIGVKLADKREIKFDLNRLKNSGVVPAVVSMHGLVTTFIRFLPEDIRVKYKVPRGLPALAERRPVFKALFALNGSAEDLDVTGADFYRLPGAALARDEIDPTTGEIRLGEVGGRDDSHDEDQVAVDAVNQDPSDNPQGSPSLPTAPKKQRKTKFDTGVSYIQISFPSAKDPSFEDRHGKITTCVVTVEADDDFVTPFDTKPKLYAVQRGKSEASGDQQRLMDRIKRDLLKIYPQLDGKYPRNNAIMLRQ
jgi:hypothetical protein